MLNEEYAAWAVQDAEERQAWACCVGVKGAVREYRQPEAGRMASEYRQAEGVGINPTSASLRAATLPTPPSRYCTSSVGAARQQEQQPVGRPGKMVAPVQGRGGLHPASPAAAPPHPSSP